MYKIELKEKEKVFLVTMSGLMKKTEIIAYINEFKKKIKSFNLGQYNIVLNIKELEAFSQDFGFLDLMEQAIILIINAPFRARYNTIPKSVVAAWQMERIGKKHTSFYNTIFTESYEEVLKLLRVQST